MNQTTLRQKHHQRESCDAYVVQSSFPSGDFVPCIFSFELQLGVIKLLRKCLIFGTSSLIVRFIKSVVYLERQPGSGHTVGVVMVHINK